MKSVIFLDLDGVLNALYYPKTLADRGRAWRDQYGVLFAPECVEALRHIVEKTEAELVISSSWKIPWAGSTNGEMLELLRRMWSERHLPGRIIDTTPNLSYQEITSMDCFARFESHKAYETEMWRRIYQPERYVIIDDEPIAALPCHQGHFIRTVGRNGLTFDDAEQAIKMLRPERCGTQSHLSCPTFASPELFSHTETTIL